MSGTLSISEADLAALVAKRVEEVLSQAKLEVMADLEINKRIGVITLDEAMRRFGKPSRRAMLDFARKHRIPVYEFSREDRYFLVKDIEVALAKHRVVANEGNGTRIGVVKRANIQHPTSNIQHPISEAAA